MKFSELRSKVLEQLFPEGAPENLMDSADGTPGTFTALITEALYDLQHHVPCYQTGNKDVYDHCATYFQCGMTVLPSPRGVINQIYVIDRLDDDGNEDPEATPDWCSKVHYHQVNYCYLKGYAKLCERCSSSNTIAVADAFLNVFFGTFRVKRRYPAPTDEGFESLPKLPHGFHYPQASTDAAGRSPQGVWAIHRGRIYIAPWIQSTETVVVEWTGKKRNFSDVDLIDDDPKLVQAVRVHVGMNHAFAYDNDLNRYKTFKDEFYGNPAAGIPGTLPVLIHECREETRVRSCAEAGIGQSAARGLSVTDPSLFYNERQSYTASCPTGTTGDTVTAVVEAGEVGSALSVADANARAKSLAQQRANAQLDCEQDEVVYKSVAQPYTAYCPGASGSTPAAEGEPVSVVVEAGWAQSTVSQDAANALALAEAQRRANALRQCTYWNAPQTYTAECPEGKVGADVTKTVAAHQHSSTLSQQAANNLAYLAAKAEAEAELICDDEPVTYFSAAVSRTYANACLTCVSGGSEGGGSGNIPVGGSLFFSITVNVGAGRITSINSQQEANTQAEQLAVATAAGIWAQRCAYGLCSSATYNI